MNRKTSTAMRRLSSQAAPIQKNKSESLRHVHLAIKFVITFGRISSTSECFPDMMGK